MAAPVCKYARFVDRVDVLEHEFTNALGASFAGRPGPVHLTIPSDVFSAQMPDSAVPPACRELPVLLSPTSTHKLLAIRI